MQKRAECAEVGSLGATAAFGRRDGGSWLRRARPRGSTRAGEDLVARLGGSGGAPAYAKALCRPWRSDQQALRLSRNCGHCRLAWRGSC